MSGRRRRRAAGRRRRREGVTIARVQTALMVTALLLAGVLLGSLLFEWAGRRLESGVPEAEFRAVPATPGITDTREDRVSVEVLNGAGDAGAAARMTERLRGLGFDVKTYGNAARFDYDRTVVIDRSGREGAARAVAEALGVSEVVVEPRPELYLDATVILGRDWRGLTPGGAR